MSGEQWHLPVESGARRARRVDRGLTFAAFLLAAAILAAYWGVWQYGFVNYDDKIYVYLNHQVQLGFSPGGVRYAFTSTDCFNWHPLTWLSLELDTTLFGFGPSRAGGYHAVNLVWHWLNSVLVFVLVRRLFAAIWPAIFVAFWFAVHPLHVESVAWIAERKDVLSTFFGLLALIAYCGYAARPTWRAYAGVLASFALSLLAKATLVTLPGLFLVLDWWPLRRTAAAGGDGPRERRGWRHLIAEKVPFLALAILICLVTFEVQRRGGTLQQLDKWPLGYRLANALGGYAFYVQKTFWPRNLAVLYPAAESIPLGTTMARAIVGLLITAVALRQRRRYPYLIVGWLWFLGTLVPMIGLVQAGEQAHADRYSYFSQLGLCIAVAGGLDALRRQSRASSVVLTAAASATVAACLILTRAQVPAWRDSETLWNNALRVTDDNFDANWNLASYYFDKGRPDDALRTLTEATRIRGDATLYVRLAGRLARMGRREQAIEQLNTALSIDPNHRGARAMLNELEAQKPAQPPRDGSGPRDRP